MTLEQTARTFFEACENGGGWEACNDSTLGCPAGHTCELE